jgi:hypothetical protein
MADDTDFKDLSDQELTEELYAAADDLNELMKQAADRRLFVPVTLEEKRSKVTGAQWWFISSSVYRKIVPGSAT